MKHIIIRRVVIPIAIVTMASILPLGSCKKETKEAPDLPRSFLSLKIDHQFGFENYRDASVHVADESGDLAAGSIFIYDSNPGSGGKLISSGNLGKQGSFTTEIRIPLTMQEVYLKLQRGSYSEFAVAAVTGNHIDFTFGRETGGLKGEVMAPTCASGCSYTISGTQTNLTVNSGEVVCVTGTLNGTIHFNSGAMKVVICGTANISNVTSSGNPCKIEISSTGVFHCPGFIQYPNNAGLVNYGTMTFVQYLQLTNGSYFENNGSFSAQALSVSGGGKFNNLAGATVNLAQNFSNFSSNFQWNGGTMIIGGSFTNYNTGYFQNKCRVEVTGNFSNFGAVDFKGGSSLKVTGAIEMEQFTTNYFIPDGSVLIETGSLFVKGTFMDLCAAPYYHRVNVTNMTIIRGSAVVSGNIDICDANGIEVMEPVIPPSITFCVNDVPPNPPCIPGGAPPPPPDADGDGVPDVSDAYPADPTRAYNSFYPDETGFVNFAFEDLWPGKGDYDFNDVVMAANYKIVTNASNKVVDLIARFKLRAFGAFLDNGFGFCLSVLPATISSVTGSQLNGVVMLDPKGFEAGHTSQTVIILYDAINTHFNGSIENTIPGKPQVVTPEETITVHFSTPQTSIGALPYNPFIFIDRDRGKEVHFPDKEPTELVNPGYFGMFEDDSDPLTGRYYRTALNHPWAIETPEVFDYPIEKADITAAYLHFAAWAESSGALYPDWFEDLPGYRNAPLIY